ncbi:ribokinase [Alkalibacillus filiformis]|uniref:Ribokinase n=1 Tax=Alkalibacillus filiformis TaxID=200990 RepID=A0ABU0DV51_9BACI|nr:ribokinase [Alkalibacillus filiformis]MDQ0352306.1 ribokinase [Alkalibacillus filiformis]
MSSGTVTVIGSINMDLVTEAEQFPNKGETLLGKSFSTIPGGKGANQAVASSKLGANVNLIGCVGNDAFAKTLNHHFETQGINTNYIEEAPGEPTGVASITIAENDNHIIVVPGANHAVTPQLVEKYEPIIAESETILLQFEIPIESVEKAVELANKHGVRVILNPAPVQPISISVMASVDYITPNEHELAVLLDDEEKKAFYEQNREKFVITHGSKGVEYFEHGQSHLVPGFSVDVVDTTGAGDSFNGALAVALTRGDSLAEGCLFGNAVGALSVSKLGAQSGMPTKEEVEEFIQTRNV